MAKGQILLGDQLQTGRATFLQDFDVSRETIERFDIYQNLLIRWGAVKNLVAPSTLPDLWMRHFGDSAQIVKVAVENGSPARTWVDMGAGAGFPGLVIAICLADKDHSMVALVESDHRKCAFLRAVSRETGVRTEIINDRMENVAHSLPEFDCVTARALAPLEFLLDYSLPLLQRGSLGLFPKGQHLASELTELTRFGSMNHEIVPSRTDPNGKIVLVRATSMPAA